MLFSAQKYPELVRLSYELRLDLLNLIHDAGGGHIGGSLSSLDLIIAVYFGGLLKNNHFILSAGHLCPALYVVLAHAGFFPKNKLSTYAQLGSPLQGHVSLDTPGVEYASGALGQGLSFACGLAVGDRDRTTVCLTSDGEHQEGQVWEAAMFASKYHLGNLINLVDHNKYQIDGSIQDIMPLDDLAAKYLRFGWTVTVVDGHDFRQIATALEKAADSTYPNCIIANTIFGKGVRAFQYDYHYHDIKVMDESLYQRTAAELESVINRLNPDYGT
ncbi:transketolase [Patescibacteria group bacterium]|nr:transketolase [Patescibacteria group bacterium]